MIVYSIQDLERFNSKIIKTDACWTWKGAISGGYGRFSIKRKNILPHVMNYEIHKGEIPKGLVLDHLCRKPSCVNPDHLEAVTSKENTLRGIGPAALNFKKTHCSKGHPYNDENTFIRKSGRRRCKICAYSYQKELYYKNKLKIKNT